MLVTFVSQCEKKALKRTRRILDAFANRIGNNVWQTAITEDGLATVKQLLRASATKSTAVSCHRVRTRKKSELVWVVGNRRKFNAVGVVPVNWTKRNLLHTEWENDWTYASSIQIIATLSALLHDIGKSTIGFQNKLNKGSRLGDPYRHEWISLKLFELMVQDCKTDSDWLNRFLNLQEWFNQQDIEAQLIAADIESTSISNMPPLAQWVAWLIVTHHRMPPLTKVFYSQNNIKRFKEDKKSAEIKTSLYQFYDHLKPIDYWVKNPKSFEKPKDGGMTNKQLKDFWQFNNLVIHSPIWQKTIKRWAKKGLNDTTLMQISAHFNKSDRNGKPQAVNNPILLHLSRLCLMIGDHNYSSLKIDDKRCVSVNSSFKNLVANTDRSSKPPVVKQTLEEHLLGVGAFTAQFARAMPIIASEMPSLKNHDPLAKPTGNKRFKWQNKAFEMAYSLAETSKEHGFFGVNMASTGAGKTIGNARIMYALADQKKGARFTIALGLRVLTLQTGLSFRENLGLKGDQLAILVGGSAHKKLFEMSHDSKTGDIDKITNEIDTRYDPQAFGSESSEDLIDEFVDSDLNVDIDYQFYDDLNLGTVVASPRARDLLFAPIVTCTVDHIIQASECKRGGKYIAPLLRLLSSDLILDEPDDFDQADLPALSRLMHLAGLMGTRVLLSSATLTPDLVTGLFEAYLTGRQLFNHSQNKPTPQVICAWFDENEKSITSKPCADITEFYNAHHQFSEKRATYLASQPIRRKAEIMPLNLNYTKTGEEEFYKQLAQTLIENAFKLHQHHYNTDDANQNNHSQNQHSKQQVSIGLVRIANVFNITAIAKQLFELTCDELPDDTIIHVTCYHAKQLLLLRNSLETKLDRILDRSDSTVNIFDHDEIKQALHNNPATNHIFMVLATPVAEVGRDHDYDWAIVEPSSMRSIIQLAGRVWRHRPDKVATTPNISIMQYNLRYFRRISANSLVFTRPGFETAYIRPIGYDLNELITDEQLQHIDARPRIVNSLNTVKSNNKVKTLSELEHKVMTDLLNNPNLNYINAYWDGEANSHRAHTHLQQMTPFRASTPQDDWLLIPRMVHDNEETTIPSDGIDAYFSEEVFEKGLTLASPHNKEIEIIDFDFKHPSIKPWLMTNVEKELKMRQKKEPDKSLRSLAITYLSVSLDKLSVRNSKGWAFHPFFGFMRS